MKINQSFTGHEKTLCAIQSLSFFTAFTLETKAA